MPTFYTYVVRYDNAPPHVKADMKFDGGSLYAVQFSDGLEELRLALELLDNDQRAQVWQQAQANEKGRA